MAEESFSIHGAPRADGMVYFTSPDLPGFRLLVDHNNTSAQIHDAIVEGLKAFLPLYKSAEARRKVVALETTSRPARDADTKSFDYRARLCEMALA